METKEKTERLGDDLVWGAEGIAQELGIEPSSVYYYHRKQLLPIRKLGKSLVASRRALQRAFAALPQA